MTIRSGMAVCALSAAAILAGCSEPRPEFVPAEGVVRVNGKPERGLFVRFSPDAANPFPASASGTTDEQGKFKLQFDFRGEQGDGAGIGTYTVSVVDTKVGFTAQGQRPKIPSVPSRYASPSTSPLTAEVKAGGPPIELDIKK